MASDSIPKLRSVASSAEHSVEEWLLYAHDAARGHYAAANILSAWHSVSTYLTVIGGVALAIITAPLVFADLSEPWDTGLKIAAFAGSTFLCVFQVAQVVCRWRERARQHKKCGHKYAHLRRRLQEIVSRSSASPDAIAAWIEEYRSAGEKSKLVPAHIWAREKRQPHP